MATKIASTSSSPASGRSRRAPGSELSLAACPACGSLSLEAVERDWTGTWSGQSYSIPNLRFFECPSCGERIYSPEAMRRIQAASPAFRKPRLRRSA